MQKELVTPAQIALHTRDLRVALYVRSLCIAPDGLPNERAVDEAIHDIDATTELLRRLRSPLQHWKLEHEARTFLCSRCRQYIPKAKMMWTKPRDAAHTCLAGALRCDDCVAKEELADCPMCGVKVSWEGGSRPYVWLEIKSQVNIAWLTLKRVRVYADVNTVTLRQFKSVVLDYIPAPYQQYCLADVDKTLAENGVNNGDTVVVVNTGPL
jgi:endogenous inhibitor of DNA gyrase (YacG/DUF329 family)